MRETIIDPATPVRRLAAAAFGAAALWAALGGVAQADALGGLLRELKGAADKIEARAGGGGDGGGATPYQREAQPRGPVEAPHPRAYHLTWDEKFTSTGLANRKLIGHDFKFYCPPAPSKLTPRRIHGTDRYAFHAVVCRAAVHAGRITFSGGNVTVRMLEGNMKLVGSTRNGVTTKSGSSGIRTLVFVD